MATKKEIAQGIGLGLLVPPFGVGLKALTKVLKKYKEKKDAAKTAKDKENIQKLIDDLKSEKHQEFLDNLRKGKPIPLPTPKEKHPLDKRKPFGGAKFRLMKKGDSVKASKYSKGGGVRKSKYSL